MSRFKYCIPLYCPPVLWLFVKAMSFHIKLCLLLWFDFSKTMQGEIKGKENDFIIYICQDMANFHFVNSYHLLSLSTSFIAFL